MFVCVSFPAWGCRIGLWIERSIFWCLCLWWSSSSCGSCCIFCLVTRKEQSRLAPQWPLGAGEWHTFRRPSVLRLRGYLVGWVLLLRLTLVATLGGGRAEARTYRLVFYQTVFTVLTWYRLPEEGDMLYLARVCPVPSLWPYAFPEEITASN